MFGWFKKKKQKELLNEIINSKVEEQSAEVIKVPYKVEAPETIKKPNHFPDCNCFKCIRWKRNAK